MLSECQKFSLTDKELKKLPNHNFTFKVLYFLADSTPTLWQLRRSKKAKYPNCEIPVTFFGKFFLKCTDYISIEMRSWTLKNQFVPCHFISSITKI